MTEKTERPYKGVGQRAAATAGAGVAIVAGLAIVAAFASAIERRLVPAIDAASIRLVDYRRAGARRLEFRISYTMKRDCDVAALAWYAAEAGGDEFAEAGVVLTVAEAGEAVDRDGARLDKGPPALAGAMRSGPVAVIIPEWVRPGSPARHYGVARMDCGMPWETNYTIGPFLGGERQ